MSNATDLLALAIGSSVLTASPYGTNQSLDPTDDPAAAPIGRIVAGNLILQHADDDPRRVSHLTLWACDSPGIGPTRGVVRWDQSAIDPQRHTVDVRYLNLHRNEAWIAGPAVDADSADSAAPYLLLRVIDGGPASPDRLWFQWMDDEQAALDAIQDMQAPDEELTVIGGNVTVDDSPAPLALRPIARTTPEPD